MLRKFKELSILQKIPYILLTVLVTTILFEGIVLIPLGIGILTYEMIECSYIIVMASAVAAKQFKLIPAGTFLILLAYSFAIGINFA